MQTLAVGNKGFTLIEMLVVLAIIAIGTAGVSLSLRDSAQSALERDAQRLAALLESADTVLGAAALDPHHLLSGYNARAARNCLCRF
jgi:type II secretion system protein H